MLLIAGLHCLRIWGIPLGSTSRKYDFQTLDIAHKQHSIADTSPSNANYVGTDHVCGILR